MGMVISESSIPIIICIVSPVPCSLRRNSVIEIQVRLCLLVNVMIRQAIQQTVLSVDKYYRYIWGQDVFNYQPNLMGQITNRIIYF